MGYPEHKTTPYQQPQHLSTSRRTRGPSPPSGRTPAGRAPGCWGRQRPLLGDPRGLPATPGALLTPPPGPGPAVLRVRGGRPQEQARPRRPGGRGSPRTHPLAAAPRALPAAAGGGGGGRGSSAPPRPWRPPAASRPSRAARSAPAAGCDGAGAGPAPRRPPGGAAPPAAGSTTDKGRTRGWGADTSPRGAEVGSGVGEGEGRPPEGSAVPGRCPPKVTAQGGLWELSPAGSSRDPQGKI